MGNRFYVYKIQRTVYLSGNHLYTREIVGVNIQRFHNRFLVIGALEDAVKKYQEPEIVHSDQGSEYDSEDFTQFVILIGAKVSMSDKGSPWQNGSGIFLWSFQAGSRRFKQV